MNARMARRVGLALVVSVGLLILIGSIAFAQAITSYTGSIQIANLSSTTANVVVEFDPQTGPSVTFPYTIAGNGGLKLFPLPASNGFNGSVIVSSDQPVFAVSSLIGNTGGAQNLYYNESYESFNGGSNKVNFPLLQANNAGNFSWFNVQNTGSATATVNISFLPRDSNMGSFKLTNVNIGPSRAKTFKLSDYTGSLFGSAGKFVGSAVITTSVGEIAGVGVQENTTSQPSLGVYDGFLGAAGSTTLVAPLLQFANGGNTLFSSLNIQNVGLTTTTVTVTYSAPVCPGCTYNPVPESKTIGPSKIGTFNLLEGTGQWVGGTARRWVGGASVQSSGQPLVGVASQLRTDANKWYSIYNLFDPSSATKKVVVPLLQFDNGQTYSSATVYNLGPDQAVVRITYGNNTCGAACTFAPAPEVLTAAVGGVVNFRLLEGANAQWTSAFATQKRYVGSGVITLDSGTGPIVVVVNQQRLSTFGRPIPPGDTLQTYTGINVAP